MDAAVTVKLWLTSLEKFKVGGENVKPAADGVTDTAPALDAVIVSVGEVLPCVRVG